MSDAGGGMKIPESDNILSRDVGYWLLWKNIWFVLPLYYYHSTLVLIPPLLTDMDQYLARQHPVRSNKCLIRLVRLKNVHPPTSERDAKAPRGGFGPSVLGPPWCLGREMRCCDIDRTFVCLSKHSQSIVRLQHLPDLQYDLQVLTVAVKDWQ